jgi:hypothetical protein
MVPLDMPEVWCPQTSWTHRVVRLSWLPRVVRQGLPERWQYRTCTTEAPATMCNCQPPMYSLRWGYFPAQVDDGGP